MGHPVTTGSFTALGLQKERADQRTVRTFDLKVPTWKPRGTCPVLQQTMAELILPPGKASRTGGTREQGCRRSAPARGADGPVPGRPARVQGSSKASLSPQAMSPGHPDDISPFSISRGSQAGELPKNISQ